MKKLKVVVIMGGISTEREISIKTGEEILKNLDVEKYIGISLLINKKEDILKIIDLKPDFCYIALHGKFGEDGSVQAILDMLDIKYSGCDMLSSSVCMDKNICKTVCKNNGVKVIPGIKLKENEKVDYLTLSKEIGNKLVIKPVDGGSSIGLYIVDNEKDFDNSILEVFKLTKEIVIEKYIKGIEISVPVIDGVVYKTVKITPKLSETFDYNSKYQDDGAIEEVYEFSKTIQTKINEMALKAYNACKCRAFARIDFLIENDEVYMLEINTLPGMTKNSILPKSLKSSGYEYKQVIDLLIESSMKNYE